MFGRRWWFIGGEAERLGFDDFSGGVLFIERFPGRRLVLASSLFQSLLHEGVEERQVQIDVELLQGGVGRQHAPSQVDVGGQHLGFQGHLLQIEGARASALIEQFGDHGRNGGLQVGDDFGEARDNPRLGTSMNGRTLGQVHHGGNDRG